MYLDFTRSEGELTESLTSARCRFFKQITRDLSPTGAGLLLITHCLPDRPELVQAMSNLATPVTVVAIPYSADIAIIDELRKRHTVETPSMEDLCDASFLRRLLDRLADSSPIIISEIGGYFADVIPSLPTELQRRIAGVVEDTEAGHRRYEAVASSMPFGVYSVARSPLKEPEDALVGASCVFSVERIIRELGTVLDSQHCLVIGFGKIGRGLARHLRDRRLPVSVYDTDPVRRVCALSEGFLIPAREAALGSADLIFGATGNACLGGRDLPHLRDGAMLISCSTRNREFDLSSMRATATVEDREGDFEVLRINAKRINLAANGFPVNFGDGAVIGPVLSLVQAEILVAIEQLGKQRLRPGVWSIEPEAQSKIAEAWLQCFTHVDRGTYRRTL